MHSLTKSARQYRAAELVSVALVALLFVRFGFTLAFGVRAALCLLFIIIAAIDLREQLIPNLLVLPFGILVLAARLLQPETLGSAVLGGAFALAPFALAAILKPNQLGGGDIKLVTVMGLLFGFPNIIWILLLAVFSGGAVALGLFLTRRGTGQTLIAYAPYLCLGALVGLFVF
jgi:Flp pilus assembly protein protease CpaA